MSLHEAVAALREARSQLNILEIQLAIARERRDELVGELVRDHGWTWRAVAKEAGVANPYVGRILAGGARAAQEDGA